MFCNFLYTIFRYLYFNSFLFTHEGSFVFMRKKFEICNSNVCITRITQPIELKFDMEISQRSLFSV